MSPLHLALLAPLALGAGDPFAARCREFVQKVLRLQVDTEGRLLLVAIGDEAQLAGHFSRFFEHFDEVGRRAYHYRGGMGSGSGSEGGAVEISFEPSRKAGQYGLHFESPDGKESLRLEQVEPGVITMIHSQGEFFAVYRQTRQKVLLAIVAGEAVSSIVRRSFREVLAGEPEAARERLVAALEKYIGPVPVPPLEEAPPGKTLIVLRDGNHVVGDLRVESFCVATRYGRLTVPLTEMKRLILPGAEPGGSGDAPAAAPTDCIVVTKRFTARGQLELEDVEVATPYGPVTARMADVRLISFGRPVEAKAAARPKDTTEPKATVRPKDPAR